MKLSIKQAYDITSAILTNKWIGIQNTSDKYSTSYRIQTFDSLYGNLVMSINAPHGAPIWSIADEFWMDREGRIDLYQNGKLIFFAYTKRNVGRAFEKSNSRLVRTGTRMLSPRFFNLLNMADTRLNGKLPTCDNTTKIQKLLKQLSEKQK